MMREDYLKNFLNCKESIINDESIIFQDGETIIDYVLVYVTDLSTISDFNLYSSRIRESFIKVLVHNFDIQIQQVYIHINDYVSFLYD